MSPPSRPPYSSSVDVRGGEVTGSPGERRVADVLGRLEPGRELFRRLAPGRVLAPEAVLGLAEAPFLPLAGLAVPDLARPFRLAPDLVPTFAVRALAVPDLALPALVAPALVVLDLAVLALAPALGVLAFAMSALTAPDLTAAPLARAGTRFLAPLRDVLALLARLVAVRDCAGRAEVAGRATDIVFAAVVRALAAELIALVAVFMDCMAVDIVFADVVALVAAAVILVAAEVTLVAAEDTVLAAVADVGLERADEVRVLPDRAGLRAEVRRVLVALVPPVLRAGRVAGRADDLVPVDLAVALEVGRAAERLAALVLTDRALPALAGLRRADARVVV
jgi:hypothetical protein